MCIKRKINGRIASVIALPVNLGGTGVATLNVSNFLIGNGINPISTNKAVPTGAVVGTTDTQTITNKSLLDNSTFIVNSTDNTKRVTFDVSNLPIGTTQIMSFPPLTTTLLGESNPATISNKTFDSSNSIDPAALSSIITVSEGGTGVSSFTSGEVLVGGATIGSVSVIPVSNGGTGNSSLTAGALLQGNGTGAIIATQVLPAGALVGTTDAQVISNKTLNSTNTINVNALSSVIPVSDGGTGVTALTSGSIMIGGPTVSTLSVLPVSLGGTGVTSLNNGEILLGGTTVTSTASLSVSNGGTGGTTFPIGELLVGNGTSAFTTLALPSGDLVGTSQTQTLENKTFIDNSTFIVDGTDNTKKAQFICSSISAGTTRVISIPNANITVVGTTNVQTISNKTIDSSNTISSLSLSSTLTVPNGGTGKTTLVANNILQGNGTGAILDTLAAPTSAIVGISDTQTLSNKTFTDISTFFVNSSDATKIAKFQVNQTSAGTRTYILPPANTTLVGTDVMQTLTNKIILGLGNGGNGNTIAGTDALSAGLAGTSTNNTAIGYEAMLTGDPISNSVAIGYQALRTGVSNAVAIGYQALYAGGTGVGIGYQALLSATGTDNTVIGESAGQYITTGSNNVILGNNSGATVGAGLTHDNNVVIGSNSTYGNTEDIVIIGEGVTVGNLCDSSVCIGTSSSLPDSASDCIIIGAGSTVNPGVSSAIVIGVGATATATGDLCLGSATASLLTSATVGAAGGAAATPANPQTYLIVKVNGTNYKAPLFNV